MPPSPRPRETAPSTVVDWDEVRQSYETTDTPVATICTTFGLTRDALDKARKRGKWRRQQPRPFPAGRPPARTTPPSDRTPAPVAETVTPSTATGGRLLERLAAAISMKLEQLERRMTKDLERPAGSDDASATDHEREARAIGALIDNLVKVTEFETGLTRTGDTPASAQAADLAGEADRYRRELAERLRKIVDTAGSGS